MINFKSRHYELDAVMGLFCTFKAKWMYTFVKNGEPTLQPLPMTMSSAIRYADDLIPEGTSYHVVCGFFSKLFFERFDHERFIRSDKRMMAAMYREYGDKADIGKLLADKKNGIRVVDTGISQLEIVEAFDISEIT